MDTGPWTPEQRHKFHGSSAKRLAPWLTGQNGQATSSEHQAVEHQAVEHQAVEHQADQADQADQASTRRAPGEHQAKKTPL